MPSECLCLRAPKPAPQQVSWTEKPRSLHNYLNQIFHGTRASGYGLRNKRPNLRGKLPEISPGGCEL